jgi:hypothetical protein
MPLFDRRNRPKLARDGPVRGHISKKNGKIFLTFPQELALRKRLPSRLGAFKKMQT